MYGKELGDCGASLGKTYFKEEDVDTQMISRSSRRK